MKNVLGIDLGFGSTKITTSIEGKSLQFNKVTTVVALLPKNEHITDANAFEFRGNQYYLFDNALKISPKYYLDVMSFDGLKEASAIIMQYVINNSKVSFDRIVIGISMVWLNKSKEFKEYISKSLNIPIENLTLIPQGIGAKIAYDTYGLDFGKSNTDYIKSKNYFGVDIGFNTVDIFQVIDGKASSVTTEGMEKSGVVKIAEKLSKLLESEYSIVIDTQDCKSIITTGTYIHRSQPMDFSIIVENLIIDYVNELIANIESNYALVINRMENLLLVGGGAALIKKYESKLKEMLSAKYSDGFLMIPELPDYYNSIGYCIQGIKLLN